MPFSVPEKSLAGRTEDLMIHLMDRVDRDLISAIRLYKETWDRFWNPLLPQEEMQALIDQLFACPSTDLNIATGLIEPINSQDKFFNQAGRIVYFFSRECPDEFTLENCPFERTGAVLPDYPDYRYRRYMTAGWTYTVEPSGKILVVAPCEWTVPGE